MATADDERNICLRDGTISVSFSYQMLISNVSDGDKMATAGIERRKEHCHASNLLVPN